MPRRQSASVAVDKSVAYRDLGSGRSHLIHYQSKDAAVTASNHNTHSFNTWPASYGILHPLTYDGSSKVWLLVSPWQRHSARARETLLDLQLASWCQHLFRSRSCFPSVIQFVTLVGLKVSEIQPAGASVGTLNPSGPIASSATHIYICRLREDSGCERH